MKIVPTIEGQGNTLGKHSSCHKLLRTYCTKSNGSLRTSEPCWGDPWRDVILARYLGVLKRIIPGLILRSKALLSGTRVKLRWGEIRSTFPLGKEERRGQLLGEDLSEPIKAQSLLPIRLNRSFVRHLLCQTYQRWRSLNTDWPCPNISGQGMRRTKNQGTDRHPVRGLDLLCISSTVRMGWVNLGKPTCPTQLCQ